MPVTSNIAASDFHRCRHLKCRVYVCFGGCTHWNPKFLVWKKIEHVNLSVSQSVALYQKYTHIKVCLVMWYTPRAQRQVKMMYIPATGSQLYSGKGICTISLMLCRKLCKNSKTRNVRFETVGNVSHICNNLPTNQGSPHKPQCTRCLHIIQEAVEIRKLHLSFPRY